MSLRYYKILLRTWQDQSPDALMCVKSDKLLDINHQAAILEQCGKIPSGLKIGRGFFEEILSWGLIHDFYHITDQTNIKPQSTGYARALIWYFPQCLKAALLCPLFVTHFTEKYQSLPKLRPPMLLHHRNCQKSYRGSLACQLLTDLLCRHRDQDFVNLFHYFH